MIGRPAALASRPACTCTRTLCSVSVSVSLERTYESMYDRTNVEWADALELSRNQSTALELPRPASDVYPTCKPILFSVACASAPQSSPQRANPPPRRPYAAAHRWEPGRDGKVASTQIHTSGNLEPSSESDIYCIHAKLAGPALPLSLFIPRTPTPTLISR